MGEDREEGSDVRRNSPPTSVCVQVMKECELYAFGKKYWKRDREQNGERNMLRRKGDIWQSFSRGARTRSLKFKIDPNLFVGILGPNNPGRNVRNNAQQTEQNR